MWRDEVSVLSAAYQLHLCVQPAKVTWADQKYAQLIWEKKQVCCFVLTATVSAVMNRMQLLIVIVSSKMRAQRLSQSGHEPHCQENFRWLSISSV
jgi:hypothetical protein